MLNVRCRTPSEAPLPLGVLKLYVSELHYTCIHDRRRQRHRMTKYCVTQIERDHAAEHTQSAQELLTELRETYEAKRAEAEPFRQRRRDLREAAQQSSEKFKCD